MKKGKYVVCTNFVQKITKMNEINRDGRFVENVSEEIVETSVPVYSILYKNKEGEIEKWEGNPIIYCSLDCEENAIKKCDQMNEEEFGILYIDALAEEFKLLKEIYSYYDKVEDKEKIDLWNKVRSAANEKIKEKVMTGKMEMQINIIEALAEADMEYEKSIFDDKLFLQIIGEFGVYYYKNCLPMLCKDCRKKGIKP